MVRDDLVVAQAGVDELADQRRLEVARGVERGVHAGVRRDDVAQGRGGRVGERVQQVRSHESELLQLADLLIGALTYANRGFATSAAKVAILERLRGRLGAEVLTRTSAFAAVKFNILVWRAQEAAG